MQPYQQRVVDEKRELDERLAKLTGFIGGGDTFGSLNMAEHKRLIRQERLMTELSNVLGERIAAFTADH